MLTRFMIWLCAVLVGTGAFAQTVDRIVAAHYPPLMIEDSIERPGIAVEVLQEAAKRAGREVDITFLPFERAIFRLLNDPDTMMPALFQGKDHDGDLHWVAEIQRAELRFSSLNKPVDTLEEARGLRTIVVENGTTNETLLAGLGFENVQGVTSPEASARMLASGRADAWFLTEQLMQRVWTQLGLTGPLQFGAVVHEVPVFLVASKALPKETSDIYRTIIEAMKEDGTLEDILARY